MHTITGAPKQLKLAGAMLAFAAMAIVLIAVALAAGNAQAQTAPYADPKPCGPGQKAVPENPDATITQGHYGIFDGYWNFDKKTLNLNLCPPSVKHRMETQEIEGREVQVEVSTRTASNIDIQKTIIHIDHVDGIADKEQFKHILTAADVEKYDFFKVGDANKDGVDDAVGTTVWWLKVDDESTPDVDEDSPLAMGFTAALFDSKYWYREEGGTEVAPLQYEFEVIREPGIPVDEQGHVFAFDDSPAPTEGAGKGIKTAFWDSSEVDANAVRLYPDDYHHLQWAFTKPGTYVISVQLKGHVRQKNPHGPDDEGYDKDWKPISEKRVETSEVGRYVFQIGPFTLNHEPAFEVVRSVKEHSATNTLVGDPIPVYQGDDDDLTFTLTGPGHSLFSVESDHGNAQIKVAGYLNYEARSEYRLTLGVSDGKDDEGNDDDSIDSVISVKISVEDVKRFSVSLSNPNPRVGESVTITLTLTDPPAGMDRSNLGMYLSEIGIDRVNMVVNHDAMQGTATVTKDSAQTVVYRPHANTWISDPSEGGGGHTVYLIGDDFSITWQD